LADLAIRNVDENGMGDRITICCRDMVALMPGELPEDMNLVVCNPPYRKAESGRVNANRQKALARHEIRATHVDVLETARRMLRSSGRFLAIYPVERATEILSKMHELGIEPKRLTLVHSYPNTNAALMLVEGVRGGRPGITVRPPLYLYREPGSYTEAIEQMFRP